ncbi:MAG TPA: beta-lactamase family protein [Sellimonas intestinalis]|uniref:serine hydrolase n=1 Tax=Lachnoclostridium sp. An169 TaxID=1965569 RepID=UPI0011245807|nr:serine hydrolase [Lachnoclostridium sp. An169]HJF00165.1 beta-lactamase family protein [Sellimonas intestinalis]
MSGIVLQEMKKLVAEEMLPGLALRVRQGGKIVLDECVGYADRGNGVKVAADTIYR